MFLVVTSFGESVLYGRREDGAEFGTARTHAQCRRGLNGGERAAAVSFPDGTWNAQRLFKRVLREVTLDLASCAVLWRFGCLCLGQFPRHRRSPLLSTQLMVLLDINCPSSGIPRTTSFPRDPGHGRSLRYLTSLVNRDRSCFPAMPAPIVS